ncbi:MAG: hypothetical protein AAF744_08475 [Pseudomonadota bacterium]
MAYAGTVNLDKMKPRGRAAMEAIELHYRAEIAEALIGGKAAPQAPRHEGWEKRPKPRSSVGAGVLKLAEKLNRRERRAIIKRLMTAPMRHRKLTAREELQLKKWVQPGADTPMIERTQLVAQLAEIWSPKEPIGKEPGDILDWEHGILRDLFPGLRPTPTNDGRPDDAEPGDPDEPGDEGSGGDPDIGEGGGTVISQLRFHVDQIECIEETVGEYRDDEISYAGIATRGPLAESISPEDIGGEITPIRAAGSFYEGDTSDQSGLDALQVWQIGTDDSLPELFLMYILMAETDPRGGFEEFRDQLFDDLSYEMPDTFWQVFSLTTWTASGFAAYGSMGGPMGAAIGWIIGATVGLLIGLFTVGNRDDIFDPELVFLMLEPNALQLPPFNGNTVSDSFTVALSGDGGEYDLTYHWELDVTTTQGGSPGDQDGDA